MAPASPEGRPADDAALRAIVEGTASVTGERFFDALVSNVARAVGTCGAWVTEYHPESQRLRALSFWIRGEYIHGWEYGIAGTPCAEVIGDGRVIHVPDNVVDHYPGDPDLREQGAVGYMSLPLVDEQGEGIGNLAVLDDKPMPERPLATAALRIFAARASAELLRLRAEAEVREREERFARLFDSAMDAIVETDVRGRITRANPAAERLFGCERDRMVGLDLERFLHPDGWSTLGRISKELDARPEGQQSAWLPDGLTARRADGSEFPAEASVSRFGLRGESFFTLILRNVNERVEAQRRIRALTGETEYLREELRQRIHAGEIEGRSEAILQVLRDVSQVADTDTTVLVLGETGTGKELVARAIHAAGPRKNRPLVVVNCGAVPATLIESEFFGHERGAFTGATDRREGRFALADGGTIVLDEIGELPLELQPKLLRVIQQRQFEPLGSSRTRTVNVRIIASTNRDLAAEVKAGRFREDLFYRLSVFPISVPPLRARGDDVVSLAESFARQFGRKLRRSVQPLDAGARARLLAYDWPGNVRELQNVIERAVITATGGRLDLSRILPDPVPASGVDAPTAADRPIYTLEQMKALERENILRALEATGWRVAGEHGAARLLGMKPTTLSSRITALGIDVRTAGSQATRSRTRTHENS